MAVIGEAFIDVKPRTDNFAKDTEKGVSSGLGSVAKKVALGFGAALATGAAVHFVEGFVKAAAESQKISRVTDAIIKSTGAAAGLSATQVNDLATSLSNLTGVDDELIQSSENILLTFTSVRNELGEGNNIFDRTTAAALDMATVLGGDATSSIQMLGKALNDPEQGLTKLARAGVVFTDQQKEQVKALQASGDLLGAQKIILDEVNKEFGGAAAAAADPFDRLSVVMGNLQEAIGGALIPVLAPAAEGLANLISDNQAGIASALTTAFEDLGKIIDFLKPGVENVAAAFKTAFDAVAPLVDKIGEFLANDADGFNKFFADNAPLAERMSTVIVSVITALAGLGVASGVLSVLSPLGSALGILVPALTAIAGPVLVITAAFVAAAAAGELLYQRVKPIRDTFDDLFGSIAPVVAALFAFLNPIAQVGIAVKVLFDNVQPVRAVIDAIIGGFDELIAAGGRLVSALHLDDVFAPITDAFSNIDFAGPLSAAATAADSLRPILQTIAEAASTATAAVVSAFASARDAITDAFGPALDFVTGLWQQYGDEVSGILAGFRDIAVAVFERVARVLQVFAAQIANITNLVITLLVPAFRILGAVAQAVLAVLEPVVSSVLVALRIAFQTFIAIVGPVWSVFWSTISDVVSAVIEPIRAVVEGILGVIRGFVDIVAGILTLDWSRAWEGVSGIATAVLEIITGALGIFLGFVQGVWANITDLLTLPVVVAVAAIQGALAGFVALFQGLLDAVVGFIGSIWASLPDLLVAPVEIGRALIEAVINAIVALFTALPGNVQDALSSFASTIAGVIEGAATSALDAAGGLVSDIVDKIGELPGLAVDKLATLGGDIAGAISTAAVDAVAAAGQLVGDVLTKIGDLVTGIPGVLLGLTSSIVSGLTGFFKSWWNAAIDALPSIDFPGLEIAGHTIIPGFDFDPSSVLKFAAGGIVPGAFGDALNAIVHGGELILNPQQQGQLLLNLANLNLSAAAPAAETPGSTIVDARFIMEPGATIIGVTDFDERLDAHAQRIADIVAGRRKAIR